MRPVASRGEHRLAMILLAASGWGLYYLGSEDWRGRRSAQLSSEPPSN